MWQHANVTICSPFRDASGYLPAFFARLAALDYDPAALRFVWVEGDSVDDTYAQLVLRSAVDSRVTLLKCDLGQPRFGSVVNPIRFRVLATVFNTALAAVDLGWSDYVLMLPCDITYQPALLTELVGLHLDVVAPFCYQSGVFYDIWGFTQNGREFNPFPAARTPARFGVEPIRLDTIGGTALFSRAVLAAGCRYAEDTVDRGLCAQARNHGFAVWGHPGVSVLHGVPA